MSKPKIFYHTGAPCQGCGGIGDYWEQLDAAGVPFAVYSVEGGGLIAEAAAFPGATLIYRTLRTDVAPYDLAPDAAALFVWETLMAHLPPEVRALRSRVWIEIGNEQDKNRADWLGHYYAELAAIALPAGYNICGPGWSTGEPEPIHWNLPGWARYLELCAANPARLGVTLHEYSLSADDIMSGSPWLVGRVQFLMDACQAQGIRPPTIFVTEAGWTHNDLPHAEKAKADIAALATLYAGYPTVKAAFLWSLMGGGDKKTLAAELNALMPWLAQYTIATELPDVAEPPTDPPPAPAVNQLRNPSFEDGWTDSEQWPATQQNPKEWTLLWNLTSVSASGVTYKLGEGVHKNRLPPAEMGVLLWDGEWTYHVFAAHRPIYPRMKQFIEALPPGRYRLKTPVFVDCFHWNKELGRKEFAPFEPNHARFMVKVNEQIVRPWGNLQIGTRNQLETIIDHAGGDFDLAVHFSCEWAADTNGFFMDGWSLEAIETSEPPMKHKAIVLKIPQDVTAAEWQQAAAYGYQFRHTMTASHDDMMTILAGGNEQSYVKLAYPARQEDVAALIEEAGYTWQPVLKEVTPPFPG